MGRNDKQYGQLKLAGGNNLECNWSLDKDQTLVKDNAPKVDEPYRDIPVEIQGVELEEFFLTVAKGIKGSKGGYQASSRGLP